MSKKRIYEVAKELGVKNQQVIDVLQKHNIEAKNNFNAIDEKAIDIVKKALKGNDKPKAKTEQSGHQDKGGHAAQNNRAHDTRANEDRNHDNRNNGGKQNNRKQSEKQDARHNDRHEKRDNNRDGNRKHDNAKNDGRHGNGHDNNRSNDANRGNDSNRNERNDRRNKRGDNHGDERRGKNDNRNDRRNKKDKKNRRDGNRPQSLLSTSLAKSKNKVKQRNEQNRQHKEEEKRRAEAAIATAIELDGPLTVKELADKMGREVSEIIKKLMFLGVMATINQEIDVDTATIVAEDFGVEVTEVEPAEDPTEIKEIEDAPETLQPRPPVVTIMGHVDHGKTSLLDVIRQTNVTAHEAGGITQHIGAYMVRYKGNKITFLDTPGHEAFTAMRLRGAQSTDIAVLVVAADDGVMPQTIEAINHAKAAGTPIIVAVNKIDKPGANPENVINQLMQYELIPEEYGGDTIFVNISAKFGQNIDELLEMILLTADVMDLQANPDQRAAGSVIEARLDKGRGTIATVLVQQGTMRVGDPIVVGNTYGRVRTMTNDRGRRVKEAVPSTPVEITGLNDVPSAGDRFVVFEDEKTARAAGEERAKRALIAERNRNNVVSVSDLFNKMAEKQMKSVPVIIKADVQGSVEALAGSFRKIDVDGVKVDILHTAVGAINESDVTLAEASGAIIIGFNVRPTPQAKQQADADKVDIRLHNVIYNAIDEIEAAMKGQLDPEFREEIVGTADVRELFKVSKIGTIVGGMVTSGKITRNSSVRLIRDGIVIYDGKLASLRRFKDDVKEVKNGYDFGLTIENYNDEKIGDVIEAYEMVEIPR